MKHKIINNSKILDSVVKRISVSDPDPYHLVGSGSGSGSVSGNVDLDPGTKKKIVINSHTIQPKL